MVEQGGVSGAIQWSIGTVLFRGRALAFDRDGFRLHSTGVGWPS